MRCYATIFLVFHAIVVAAAPAAVTVIESTRFADNDETLALWFSIIGLSEAQHFVDWETGFGDTQNVAGGADLFPGELVIRSSNGMAVVRTGRVFGGSNPIGLFALLVMDQAQLTLDFSARPVDYVSFYDIDHTTGQVTIQLVDGSTAQFSIPTTAGSGNSAEFYGIFRNNMPRIEKVIIHVSGDTRWGLDDIRYGGPDEEDDCDTDGILDASDNCPGVPNPTQCNPDGDRHGNHCDPDLNGDDVVGIPDFNAFRFCFGFVMGHAGFRPDCDFNCDGAVGIPDFNILRAFFGRAPGSPCP